MRGGGLRRRRRQSGRRRRRSGKQRRKRGEAEALVAPKAWEKALGMRVAGIAHRNWRQLNERGKWLVTQGGKDIVDSTLFPGLASNKRPPTASELVKVQSPWLSTDQVQQRVGLPSWREEMREDEQALGLERPSTERAPSNRCFSREPLSPAPTASEIGTTACQSV